MRKTEPLVPFLSAVRVWMVLICMSCTGEGNSDSAVPPKAQKTETQRNAATAPSARSTRTNAEPTKAVKALSPKELEERVKMIEGALAQIPTDTDKTLSPFFFVMSRGKETDALPLKSTRADVHIASVIADVKLTQVYENNGKNPIEALYLFPASTRAAVYAMKMTIGDRTVEARIKEREQAKKEYEQALNDGKTASLLEQHRPNVFEMSVGNILPGDSIKVELHYTELMIPSDRIYEFVMPSVVGPRYSNSPASAASAAEKWIENPYLHKKQAPPYTFGVDLSISAAVPIAQLSCPSHQATVTHSGNATAHVALPDGPFGNKDFIVRYSLAGEQIQEGVLLYPGKEESFFLAMVQPPARVAPEQIVPREYIFVMDVSGSMNGFPIEVSKKLLHSLLSGLSKRDSFNVVLFAGGSAVLGERSISATEANLTKAFKFIDAQQGGGGTELLPALRSALALPRVPGVSRNVVIATDGYVTVEKEAFNTIASNLGRANFFAFGIGSSVNRYLIEGMARVGRGAPFIVESEAASKKAAQKFKTYVESPVLTGIAASFDGFYAYDVEPKSIPDLFAERPLLVFGKYRGDPKGELRISGKSADGDFAKRISLVPSETGSATAAFGGTFLSEKNAALPYLWARDRIAELKDFNQIGPDESLKKEITSLGLKYNLMTEYTSFVAVDTEVRADGKKVETVRQPLPLPEGVSDLAVGDGFGYGGLGLKGTGRGGGGIGAGSIGLGALGTIGHGGGGGSGSGYGRGGLRGNAGGAPSVRSGAALVKGSLSKEVIRRIVHRHMNEVKFCYERELAKQPKLSGRVSIKFIIKADGGVQDAAVSDSTVKNPAMENCIAAAVRRWTFPECTAGIVIVTYPFQFAPGN